MAGENKVLCCHTLALRLGSGPYIRCDTSGRTSGHKTIHFIFGSYIRCDASTSFKENLILSSQSTYSPTPKANTDSLNLLTQIETSMQSNNAKLT
jgi:hypothetical protein